MAIHKDFPKSPYEILDHDLRWFPADEALREQGYDKLLPPPVPTLRKKVKEWRDSGCEGASATSSALTNIHNRLLQKDRKLSLQIDVTATPKHSNGAIFVQTFPISPDHLMI